MPEPEGWEGNSFCSGHGKEFFGHVEQEVKCEGPEGGKGSSIREAPLSGTPVLRSHPHSPRPFVALGPRHPPTVPGRASRQLAPPDPPSGAAPLLGTLRKVTQSPHCPGAPASLSASERALAGPGPPLVAPRTVAPAPPPVASRTRSSLARVRPGAPGSAWRWNRLCSHRERLFLGASGPPVSVRSVVS